MADSRIPGPPRRFRRGFGRAQWPKTAAVVIKSGPILTGYLPTKTRPGRHAKRLPASANALCGDLLSTHMRGLTDAVSGALHGSPSASPGQRLESVTKAWLDFVEPSLRSTASFWSVVAI